MTIQVVRKGFPDAYNPDTVHAALIAAGYPYKDAYGRGDEWVFVVSVEEAQRTAVETAIDSTIVQAYAVTPNPVAGMYLIEDQELSADTANFDFESIPQTFKHLVLYSYARSSVTGIAETLGIRFNGDSGNNYDHTGMNLAHNASFTTAESLSTSQASGCNVLGNSATALRFSSTRIDILDYTEATNYHNVMAQSAGQWGTTTGLIGVSFAASVWKSAAAITRITIAPATGNLMAGSRCTLYGLG